MSHPADLAFVSATLAAVLQHGMDNSGCAEIVGGPITVTALPLAESNSAPGPHRLNLALVSIVPSPEFAVPQSRSLFHGESLATPQLPPLDLVYLLTSHSAAPFGSELLLGHALRLLQGTPIVDRAKLQDRFLGSLRGPLHPLAQSAPAWVAQTDQLRITSKSLSLDDLTHLFRAAQAPLRPAAAFQVTRVPVRN